jgi:thioredoxin reductase (NADPH)
MSLPQQPQPADRDPVGSSDAIAAFSAVAALLVVSPDVVDRDSVVEGLRTHYGARYRTIGAASLREAADALAHLTAAGNPVAVVVAAHRLPDGTAIQLFGHVKASMPSARRVLLTTMDQADAALQAISQAQLDRYVVLPAHPLEHRLYPILDDLLLDWEAQHAQAEVGVTVLGHRFSATSYLIKDYLARSLVPYTWFDLSDDPEAQTLARELNLPSPAPTTVLIDDGRVLYDPPIAELARALGLTQDATRDQYDLVVVGGGPAGLAAAVYGACEGLSCVVVEDDCPGGQASTTSKVEDCLGFPAGLTGADFAHRALAQARRLGVEWCSAKVATQLAPGRGANRVALDNGTVLVGRAVLIATGMTWRRLDAPGVEELNNAGVYYGASIADARSTAGEDVVIVGSGNSAGQAALTFARHARSVILAVREDSMPQAALSEQLIEQLEKNERIDVHCGTEVGEAKGYGRLEKVVLLDIATGRTETISASSLYILIGTVPFSEWVHGVVAQDEFGFILTDTEVARRPEMHPSPWPLDRPPLLAETSVPGIFAAGDVRAGTVKRISSAVGQGAVAIAAISQYLDSLAEVEDSED